MSAVNDNQRRLPRTIHPGFDIPEEYHNPSRWLSPARSGTTPPVIDLPAFHPGRGNTTQANCTIPAGIDLYLRPSRWYRPRRAQPPARIVANPRFAESEQAALVPKLHLATSPCLCEISFRFDAADGRWPRSRARSYEIGNEIASTSAFPSSTWERGKMPTS